MDIKEAIAVHAEPELTGPPAGALDRLENALLKAKAEGRGKRTLIDLTWQFFTALEPAGRVQYCAIALKNDPEKVFISGYERWAPKTEGGGKKKKEQNDELFDCWALANEINAL